MQSIFFDHNGMTLEINNQRKTEKFTNLWKLNIIILTKMGQRIKHKEIKNHLEMNENKENIKTYGTQKKNC